LDCVQIEKRPQSGQCEGDERQADSENDEVETHFRFEAHGVRRIQGQGRSVGIRAGI